MRIMTAAGIEQLKIEAGGPGSGRKPGYGGIGGLGKIAKDQSFGQWRYIEF